ncbi:radical SAM protein [Streptomyces sp. ACT015]|uniref:radical SAM protein n=1 Tax=Streptomyces sp. ACT015 TaxID=3134807 RepID=UPI003D184AC4
MWERSKVSELSPGISPESHSFTYTYPPPYVALDRSSRGGFDIAEAAVWPDFSMYVHFPFCRMNCNFCSLHRQTAQNEDMVSSYLQALSQELRLFGDTGCVPPLRALYLGGGTPTMLSADELNQLLDGIAAALRLPYSTDVEVTIECAPEQGRDVHGWAAFFRTLTSRRQLPVTRASVGVEAWNDAVLSRMGRTAATVSAIQALVAAVNQEVATYNVDFLVGYPRGPEGPREEGRDIVSAVSALRAQGMRVPSVSIYQLWGVENIPISRTALHTLPPADDLLQELWTVQSALYDLGYIPGYGTAFVRGAEDLHRWTRHRYESFRHLGFGSGSYSFLPDGLVQRERDVARYRALLAQRSPHWGEVDRALNLVTRLSAVELEMRRIICGLRSGTPVPPPTATSAAELEELASKLNRLTDLGVLERRSEGLALSADSLLLTNAVSSYLHPGAMPRKPPAAWRAAPVSRRRGAHTSG